MSTDLAGSRLEGRGEGYASWLAGRLRRLVVPVLPVLAVWTFIGLGATGNIGFGSYRFYAESFVLRIASQFALLPAWFLVVYIVVVLLVPLSHRAWRRYGMASFWTLAGAAALVDLLALGAGWGLLGWLNYLFVWLAVHQLGYAWQAGGLGNPQRCLLWAAGGIAVLIALVCARPVSDQHGVGARGGGQQQPAAQGYIAGAGRLSGRPAAGVGGAGAAAAGGAALCGRRRC